MATVEQKSPSNPRQKMNYACEACRAAKTRCQSGPQPDICKRCSEFKRECIFRTGPRTRRPRTSSRIDSEAASLPPPPGPSKTFSIDFEMPAEAETNDDFEKLRQHHERVLEDLVLQDDDQNESKPEASESVMNILTGRVPEPKTFSFNDMSSAPSVSLSGTSSSWTESSARNLAAQKSKPLMNLGIKPQFNLDSAAKLLASFREMLPHMPCLVLPENLDVRSLARHSPFVLLAILAVTSCSTSLQGHSLYDEEFRKVLGLKFVAGGERSLELLQGILIYCAWYPFHLRPRNKQSFQYLRMAVDIVHDLEMDQEPDVDLPSLVPNQRARKLDDIRALLCCFYSMSAFSATWNRPSTLRYSPQLSRCAEVLDRNSELEQDHHLAWLVRFQYIFEELIDVQRNFERGPRDHQSEMQRNLIRAGLEAQFRDFKQKMPEQYASTTSIFLASQVTEAIMLAPALMRIPRKFGAQDAEQASSRSLLHAAQVIRSVFDHILSLMPRPFAGFCGADYGRFIVTMVFSYRLSFPLLASCRDYDVAQGRRILDLGAVLQQLVDSAEDDIQENGEAAKGKKAGAPAGVGKKSKKTDAASALKVVLRSVKVKFDEKSAAFEAMSAAATGEEWAVRDSGSSCPMINGSLDSYISLWAGQQQPQTQGTGSYATSLTSSSGLATTEAASSIPGLDSGASFVGPMAQMELSGEDKPLMYHDLWTSMTLGWAGDMGDVNMEDIVNMGYGEFLEQS
ncbi:hypothetical protein F5B22DRAFT_465887 [Xylaria bambusicola]|uniref:uncharacterized protein n=1 Tax=Xylaria bambusicola TaxID=326684 RepID=UPI0020073F34|nr:uncharacterized protein F5B22DRAFT_465887 [Xylaria bambusicola]KAI0522226.1 hypothetical protein F5B22DRAFT_465887 [Xylaria bambusicola]